MHELSTVLDCLDLIDGRCELLQRNAIEQRDTFRATIGVLHDFDERLSLVEAKVCEIIEQMKELRP